MRQRRAAAVTVLPEAAALCLGSIWLASCAEPRFARDAAVESARADTAQEDDVDPRWAPWVGRYAARSILYTVDGLLRPTTEELSLVLIEPRGERLIMRQQLCHYQGGWAFLLEGNIRYRYPESTAFEAELMLEGRNFETPPARLQLGFELQPPRACAAARTAGSEQPWHDGECTCPRDTDALPADASDCRVTDPDHDGKPGVTVDAAISGTQLAYYGVQDIELRYSDGYRIDDRLYASVERRAQGAVFGCSMPGISANCAIGIATPCAAEFNPIVFVPLADDDYDCARIVRERAGLFPEPIPPFPSACANTP